MDHDQMTIARLLDVELDAVAPSSMATRKAAIVFSGADAEAPR